MTTFRVEKTEHGFEVWDGRAYETPPLAFPTLTAAKDCADELNAALRRTGPYADENPRWE